MAAENWGDRESLTPERARGPLWPWLALAAIALVAVVYLVSSPRRLEPSAPHPLVGQPLAALSLEPLAGAESPLSLAELRGQVALVHFWGPWCGPCAMEFPQLLKMKELLARQKAFQFVSISYPRDGSDDEGLQANTEAFLQRLSANLPTHADPTHATIAGLARQMRQAGDEGFAFPTSVVIDKSSIIRGVWVGYHPGADRDMLEIIERALAAPAP